MPRVANGLDIVAVGIEDEGSIVTGMVIRAYSRRAIVFAAGRDGFRMKPVHHGTVLRREGDMGAGLRGASPTDPEEGLGAIP